MSKLTKAVMKRIKPVYRCPVGGGIRNCEYETEFKPAMTLHLLTQHDDNDLMNRSNLDPLTRLNLGAKL